MRFDRLKDPAAMAAKDPGRYGIQGVAVVLRDGGAYLAATDGHALSLVRAHLDDTDKPDGVYPVAAFTAARKAAKNALGGDGVAIELHDDDRDRVPFVVRPIYPEGGTDDGSFGAMMPIGGGA